MPDPDGVPLSLRVAVCVGEMLAVWLPVEVRESVVVDVGVSLGVIACEPERLPVPDKLPPCVGVSEGVLVAVPDDEPPCEGVMLVEAVRLTVVACDPDLLCVNVGVAPCEALGVALEVRVPEGL